MWLNILFTTFLLVVPYLIFKYTVCPYCQGETRPSWTLHDGNCIHCGAWWIGGSYKADPPKKKETDPLFDSEII